MTKAIVAAGRRGRPPATSARELELVALRMFSENGFEETTVDDIAAEAGVSGRTFFRYFESKSAVLWREFDAEVAHLRQAFLEAPVEMALMRAIAAVVVGVNHYRAEDVPELRARMNLIGSVSALQASAAPHYDAWERAVSEFAAARLGEDADDLLSLAIGRCTLAAARAAFDLWVRRADADLTTYLAQALEGLGRGFEMPVPPA